MKLNLRALQLLTLCHIVAASPCKPPSSSVTTGLTTADAIPISETTLPSSIATTAETGTTESVASLETDTASESATSLEASPASESETLLTESIIFTWGATSSEAATTSEGTVSYQATSASETEVETATTEIVATLESTPTSEGTTTSEPAATSEATITTSTAIEPETTANESITTSEPTATSDMHIISTNSAEPTTTTSTLPQGPTNVLLNPGFEDNTVSPWIKNSGYESISVSTSEFHTGAQSGYMTGKPGFSATMGFKQTISASLIEADKVYEFSAYAKTTNRVGCTNVRRLTCFSGVIGFKSITWGGPDNTWNFIRTTCTWTQAQLNAGPGISIFQYCEELDFYIDDVVLVEVV